MSTIKFRLAAKTDMGLVRTNNEDNFQLATDLSSDEMRWVNNEICSLGEKGALLVVADGMGGMNAGEVASALAIETVREYFTPEKLTPDILGNRFAIEKFMNSVIIAADERIKSEGKEHPESRGMGTTIVIAWLLDGRLYVSWCGDSRAYIYNPSAGLHQITKDHSYVQSLVDKGVISREDAFDYPDSNIITRSLCDGGPKAKPESLLKPYDLCDNDIILLCTDGLSGMIRDNEIEEVIRAGEHNMDTLADSLIQAACDAEGSDNVTVCLCRILQGGGVCDPDVFIESERRLNGKVRAVPQSGRTVISGTDPRGDARSSRYGGRVNKIQILILICLIIIIVGGAAWGIAKYLGDRHKGDDPTEETSTEVVQEQPAATGGDIGETVEPEPVIRQEETPGKKTRSIFGSSTKKTGVDDSGTQEGGGSAADTPGGDGDSDMAEGDDSELTRTGRNINDLSKTDPATDSETTDGDK